MSEICPHLVKECDNENQLKYVYNYDNSFPIISKVIIVIIASISLTFNPSIPYKLYSSLVILISVILFNQLKINHRKFTSESSSIFPF